MPRHTGHTAYVSESSCSPSRITSFPCLGWRSIFNPAIDVASPKPPCPTHFERRNLRLRGQAVKRALTDLQVRRQFVERQDFILACFQGFTTHTLSFRLICCRSLQTFAM